MPLRRCIAVLAGVLVLAAGPAAQFEAPPDEEPGASLSPAQVSGQDFHIEAPVHSDGLMHHYLINSRFGPFPAYGRDALEIRLREVAALTSIAKTSDTEVALQAVGRSLQANVDAVTGLARNPVGAVTGIPRGIGHLFGGYRAQAQELTDQARGDLQQHKTSGQPQSSVVSKSGAEARRYADRYLGVSKAEMRWYQRLAVDPYTGNEVLRAAVRHLAKVDAAASFGMRFVPGIPYAGELGRALNTIYNEDPAVLRKQRRETLAQYGLTAEEISRFENTLLLSPTRQGLLVEYAGALGGVAGRAELFRHAMSVTSEAEIEVFLHSAAMLVQFHARQSVARIVEGLRLPTAQLADGTLEVFGSFDAVYWTEAVAAYEHSLGAVLPKASAPRQAWLAGSVSPLAREQLEALGWRVHEHAEDGTRGAAH
jgi:hypothetical protein